MRTLPLVLLAALALIAGGCGSSSSTTATTGTAPVASAPDATAPPPDATQPGTGPASTPTAPTTPSQTTAPSGSSGTSKGSQPTIVPANFAVKGGKLIPPGVSAPAKVPIDITMVSKDGKAHQVLLEIPPKPRTLGVPASGRLIVRVPGLRAGTYGIELDNHVAGGLVIGRSPGP
jgi:hypothetical protein